MRHHLKKFQKLPASVIASVWLSASRWGAEFSATHPLREKYKAGDGRHVCLPKIDGLPTLSCKECPTCSRLFPTEEGPRRHFAQKHEGISRKDVRALEKVSCQSLATYRAEGGPFRVAVEGVVEPIVEAIDPVATALSS